MRTSALLFCLAFSLALLGAQNDRGVIAGTVSDPFGVPVANAPVQAKTTADGHVFKTTSGKNGQFILADLPAGAYDVIVNIPGLKTYDRKGMTVAAAKTAQLEIRLEEGSQLSTLGEDPTAIAADEKKHAPPTGPAPRTVDGKPDLSGLWWRPVTADPGKPQFQARALAVAKQRMETNRKDSPQSHCLPGAVLRLGPLYELVQSHDLLVEISDDDYPGFHQIYLDGRAHPKDPNPAWYGHSIGRWEGDTLVVDRVGFDDRVWLDQDGHPHSDKLHVVERYRRPDFGHLETVITVEDPAVLEKPFTMVQRSDLAPTEEIHEFICNENERDASHLIGK
jgi:hypothetical protein